MDIALVQEETVQRLEITRRDEGLLLQFLLLLWGMLAAGLEQRKHKTLLSQTQQLFLRRHIYLTVFTGMYRYRYTMTKHSCWVQLYCRTVLQIRNVLSRIRVRPFSHPGSRIRLFFHPGSYMKSGMQTYCFLESYAFGSNVLLTVVLVTR
jgi:hypothetical protein